MFAGRVVDVAGVPGNPNVLYVGSASAGLYKSTNGGTTFDPVFESGNTLSIGAIAVQTDNPDVVYAGMYDYLRQPWHFRSGGPGSGFYRSADGGVTWKKLTDPALKNGLPGAQVLGRVGVSIHESDPRIVYALIEAKEAGVLWRSDDRGASWKAINSERRINN